MAVRFSFGSQASIFCAKFLVFDFDNLPSESNAFFSKVFDDCVIFGQMALLASGVIGKWRYSLLFFCRIDSVILFHYRFPTLVND